MTAPFILAEAPVLVLALHSACHFILHTRTHSRTHTHTENSPEPCFSEAPATAHEICLYHLVAVKVLVWTTVSASGPQSIKQKTERQKDEGNRLCYMFLNLSKATSLSPLMCCFTSSFSLHLSSPLLFSPLLASSLLLPSKPCGSAPLGSSVGCQFLMIIW